MANETPIIRRSVDADLVGILALQTANQQSVGGHLSAGIPSTVLAKMIESMPVIVAVVDERVVGFLIISTVAMNAGIPIVEEMLKAYPISGETYVAGPICVSADMRGKGVAHELFKELSRVRPGLQCVNFIRRDNLPSIRAHLKIGWKEVGEFVFNQADHVIFTYTA